MVEKAKKSKQKEMRGRFLAEIIHNNLLDMLNANWH